MSDLQQTLQELIAKGYVQHLPSCEKRREGIDYGMFLPCTCGLPDLSALLTAGSSEKTKEDSTRVDEQTVIPPERATASED